MATTPDINDVIKTHYGSGSPERMVGKDRRFDSGYSDIYRFFGPERIEPAQVRIIHEKEPFCFGDEKIRRYASKCEHMLREEGRLKDGPDVTRLLRADLDSEQKSITVQRATYGQFAGSCFFLDADDPAFGEHRNLRGYYVATRESADSADNPLAACFGISAQIVVQEGERQFILRTRRAAGLATLTGTHGASVAGVVDYDSSILNLEELIEQSLSQEMSEEINLGRQQYEIIPLAHSLELFRGEHPQLFCLVRCVMDRDSLAKKMREIDEQSREFDNFDFLPITNGQLGDFRLADEFNFEGKMSYYLAEEYLTM